VVVVGQAPDSSPDPTTPGGRPVPTRHLTESPRPREGTEPKSSVAGVPQKTSYHSPSNPQRCDTFPAR